MIKNGEGYFMNNFGQLVQTGFMRTMDYRPANLLPLTHQPLNT